MFILTKIANSFKNKLSKSFSKFYKNIFDELKFDNDD